MEQFGWEMNGSEFKSQDLDQYLNNMNGNINEEIDDLFNETLLGIQDLDVPTGFVPELEKQPHHSASNSFNYHQARHSRKISGTAIFGFDNHTRGLSLDFKDDKAISPLQLVKMVPQNNNNNNANSSPKMTGSPLKSQVTEDKGDYLVTNSSPKAYKFPPSSSSPPPPEVPSHIPASYSAKYLQELSRLMQQKKQNDNVYVDDIEPLLQHNDETSKPIKYVPIPIQEPSPTKKFSTNNNTFLPPPTPGKQGDSPGQYSNSPGQDEVSPEPFTRDSSPVNYFYNPQFFSDDNYLSDNYSSPMHPSQIASSSVSSSPLKQSNLNSSPFRQNIPSTNVGGSGSPNETVDVNETITQISPLRSNQVPMTPSRNRVVLEWSPIVSPSAKNSKNVTDAIRQSSPKKRIKKTSLLPPGELDRYFEGPDDQKIFTCTYKSCGKKFTRRYNVRSHIQTHLSDRPFACMYCPKKFVRQHDLNRHIKGHLEARHCRCPCGKEFTRIDAMKKHRLRNICSGGVEDADILGRSPDRSPAKQETDITRDLLQMTDIPQLS